MNFQFCNLRYLKKVLETSNNIEDCYWNEFLEYKHENETFYNPSGINPDNLGITESITNIG